MSGTSRATVRWSYVVRTKEVTRAINAATEEALVRIGRDWTEKAQDRTPVDTGALQSSITWATSTQKEPVQVIGGGTHTPTFAPRGVVHVGSNLAYAPFVHEGVHAQTAQVRRHLVRAHARTITSAFGKPIAPTIVNVRAFMRGPYPMNIPERAPVKFIEGPARDHQDAWQQWVIDAVNGIENRSVQP